jgi:hypothetical protein
MNSLPQRTAVSVRCGRSAGRAKPARSTAAHGPADSKPTLEDFPLARGPETAHGRVGIGAGAPITEREKLEREIHEQTRIIRLDMVALRSRSTSEADKYNLRRALNLRTAELERSQEKLGTLST